MREYGLDAETTQLWDKKNSLRTVQIYNPVKDLTSVFFFPKGNEDGFRYQFDPKTETVLPDVFQCTKTKLREFLSDPENTFITHSGLFDQFVILRDLNVLVNISGDSFILASLIPTAIRVSRSLDAQMKIYVDPEYDKGLYGSWENFDWDAELLFENAIKYAARDAKGTYLLEKAQRNEHPKRANAIYQLELNLLPVLTKMRMRGIRLDGKEFMQATVDYRDNLLKMEAELSKERGKPIRVASNAEVAEWLYEERGNECQLITKSGKQSVSKEALDFLTDPIIEKIRKTKECQSTSSSLNKLLENGPHEKENETWIFHPEFRPLSETYGSRIYTQGPSVNQFSWAIRESIKPEAGIFYYGDVSAFEFMLLAYAAGEEELIKVYEEGGDIHTLNAANLFSCTQEEVTEDQRERAKVVCFATVYGTTGHSVARSLKIELDEAIEIVEKFLNCLPKMKRLRDAIHAKCMETGIARTPFKRVRRVFETKPRSEQLQSKIERQAFNFFAQSGSADIQKQVLTFLDRRLPEDCHLVFTVFDSFLIQINNEKQKEEVDRILAEGLVICVAGKEWKFRFKSGTGTNWLEAKKNAN